MEQFGVTGGCENLQPDEIERIENHKLDDINFYFGEIQI